MNDNGNSNLEVPQGIHPVFDTKHRPRVKVYMTDDEEKAISEMFMQVATNIGLVNRVDIEDKT
jgi:hypothetical protein